MHFVTPCLSMSVNSQAKNMLTGWLEVMSFAVEGLLGLITDDFCCHEFKEHTSLVTTPTRYAEKSNMMDVFFWQVPLLCLEEVSSLN